MADIKTTDLTLKTVVPTDAQIAIVSPSDLLQSPTGSDYKIDISTFLTQSFRGSIDLLRPAPTAIGSYIPTQSGTYTNFGGLIVDLTDGVTTIIFDGTNFTKQVVPIDLEGYVAKTDIVDNLTSASITGALSAGQGKILNETKVGLIAGKNIFNKDSVNEGFYISAEDGVVATNSVYAHSDYISVLSLTQYKSTSSLYSIVFYDSNKNYISGVSNTLLFSTPSNAKFIRISYTPLDLKNTLQLETGNTSNAYEIYKLRIDSQFINTKSLVDEFNLIDPVNGKAVSDSLKNSEAIAFLNKNGVVDLIPADFTFSADNTGFYGSTKEFFNGADLKPFRIQIYSSTAGLATIGYYKLEGTIANQLKTQSVSLLVGINNIIVDESGLGLTTTPNDSIFVGVKPSDASGILMFKSGNGFNSFKISDSLVYTAFNSFSFSIQMITLNEAVINKTKIQNLINVSDELLLITGGLVINEGNIQALINDNDFIQLPAGIIEISNPILVPTGKRIEGIRGKTIIKLINGCNNAFLLENVKDVNISHLTILGSYATPDILSGSTLGNDTQVKSENGIGLEKGIIFKGSSYDNHISEINFFNLSHSGIYVEQSSETPTYTGAMKGLNLNAKNCYSGYYFHESGEYSELINIEAQNCNFGIITKTGNLYLSNCSFVYNRVGFAGLDGVNDSHSSISNTAINHNKLYNIFIFNTEKGWFFNGCEIFEAVTWLENSKGFVFNGGRFRGEVTVINGGVNLVSNSMWEINSVTKIGTTNFKAVNNFNISSGTDVVVV